MVTNGRSVESMPRGEMPGVPQILTVRKTVDTLEENAGNFFFRRSSHHCHQPPAFPQPHESSRQREPDTSSRVVLSVLSHFTTEPQIAARLPRGRRARFFWRRVARARTVAASNSRGEYSVERCSPVRQGVRLPDLRGHQDGFRGEKLRGR